MESKGGTLIFLIFVTLAYGDCSQGIHLCTKPQFLIFDTHGAWGWPYELGFDLETLILGSFVKDFIVEP